MQRTNSVSPSSDLGLLLRRHLPGPIALFPVQTRGGSDRQSDLAVVVLFVSADGMENEPAVGHAEITDRLVAACHLRTPVHWRWPEPVVQSKSAASFKVVGLC